MEALIEVVQQKIVSLNTRLSYLESISMSSSTCNASPVIRAGPFGVSRTLAEFRTDVIVNALHFNGYMYPRLYREDALPGGTYEVILGYSDLAYAAIVRAALDVVTVDGNKITATFVSFA